MKHTALGYVDIRNCRVIYQNGQYNDIVKLERLKGIVDVVEVYSQKKQIVLINALTMIL